MEFQVAGWSTELLGRLAGGELRAALKLALLDEAELVIDFDGVTDMSPSFADECFGMLIRELAEGEAPPRIIFANVDPALEPFLRFAVANRHPEPVA